MSRLFASSAMVATDRASLTYGAGGAAVSALTDISLEIHPGEMVLLMGPSGSGKTSLLQLIGGLIRPTAGEVYVDGRALSKLDESDLSELRLRRFGFIFQNYNLFQSLRAWENVAVALELLQVKAHTIEPLSRALLSEVGLSSRADAFPRELSGGQKQRVAIARALAAAPAILLADEPTAALDSQSGEHIGALLNSIAHHEHRAVIVATHDARLKDLADRIIKVEDGCIFADVHPSLEVPHAPAPREQS